MDERDFSHINYTSPWKLTKRNL